MPISLGGQLALPGASWLMKHVNMITVIFFAHGEKIPSYLYSVDLVDSARSRGRIYLQSSPKRENFPEPRKNS